MRGFLGKKVGLPYLIIINNLSFERSKLWIYVFKSNESYKYQK